MFTRTLQYGRGYTGKLGNKCWVAAITGTSERYGLQRAFIDPDSVRAEHPNRPRTMIDFSWQLDVGLYEASERGERWFFVVNVTKTGEYKAFRPTDTRVRQMAALMDGGMSAEDARRATRPANSAVAQGV